MSSRIDFPLPIAPAAAAEAGAQAQVLDRSIGDLLRRARRLNDEQVERILQHQQQHGLRFGEAAIALKLASSDDILWALSQQFHYPYAPSTTALFHDDLVAAIDPFSAHAELFRDLRSQLMMGVLAPEQPRRALAVLSPDVGDGKSFVAANLAVTFSQLGGRTLLVDADMRTPRQQQLFKLNGHTGLSSILSGRADSNVIHQVTDLPSLYVLPVGAVPPNPLELVQRPAFTLLLQELVSKFDHVVVDTPAAAHGADAKVLAAKCGAAIAVGRKGRTPLQRMEALLQSLGKTTVRMGGVLMNAR